MYRFAKCCIRKGKTHELILTKDIYVYHILTNYPVGGWRWPRKYVKGIKGFHRGLRLFRDHLFPRNCHRGRSTISSFPPGTQPRTPWGWFSPDHNIRVLMRRLKKNKKEIQFRHIYGGKEFYIGGALGHNPSTRYFSAACVCVFRFPLGLDIFYIK